MTAYDLIFEEIQNRYDSGVLTEEQAIEVNDLAYEKYVIEGNTYNKYMNNKQDELSSLNAKYNHLINKAKELEKLGPNGKEKAKEVIRQAKSVNNKRKELIESLDDSHSSVHCTKYKKGGCKKDDYPRKFGVRSKRAIKRKIDMDRLEQSYYKKDWMERHGDRGIEPEKKYIPNRYLDAQNAINKK